MPEPSEDALAMVGKVITFERHSPRPRKVAGTCIGVECVPGTTVTTDDGTFPAVRFLIRPTAGGRAVWTDAFADVSRDDVSREVRGVASVPVGPDYATGPREDHGPQGGPGTGRDGLRNGPAGSSIGEGS